MRPLSRAALVSMKPLTRCSAASTCTTAGSFALRHRDCGASSGPWIGGKTRPAAAFSLYSTPSEASVTASAVWIPPSSACGREDNDKGYYAAASASVRKKRSTRTTKSISAPYPPAGEQGFHLLRRIPEHSAQPEALEVSGIGYQHVRLLRRNADR